MYIPQIDGKDLWISNYSSPDVNGYSLINKNGEPNLKRYKASFDYSLDLIQLRDVYSKAYRNNRFSFMSGSKEYSNSIINVTFEYSVREFNRTGSNLYVKLGATLDSLPFDHGLAKCNDEILAVQVEQETPPPPSDIELPKYFYHQDGCYHIKQNVRTVASVSDIRKKLYKDGFVCNGIKYVRWKRSSGSARVGRCLFIDEKLYNRFHRWEMCGLDVRRGDKVDLAALESYISLTSSSIIGTLQLSPYNILVVDDYDSIFEDDVINVIEENGRLSAQEERATITNSIFDGESLIDISVMGKYQDKGMVLLRNRFFKSCCFNTKIQKWFFDNKITDVSQLNGFTLADSVSDIKLITTPSSIKYLKFSTLEQWFENIDDIFGVVKYEKPPHFMDGKLVQTHYQLINSIQLEKAEMQELLAPTFHFMDLVKERPDVLRFWIKFHIEDEIEITPVKSKTDVIYKMMSVNEDFCKTKLYYDFKTDFLKSFTKDLKCGHILINGNYSTLCGNPIELLMLSIGTFNGAPIMDAGCVFSKRFEWGAKLLGSRSPHITMSNVLLTENRYNDAINRYMNPTDEIVYVNSIGENILQRLAGCDYDSDSLLLTDNSILIKAAARNGDKFKVPVCSVGGSKKSRRYITEDQADLDIRTSKNLIGDIVNMSQELNSRIWDMLASGKSYDEVQDIYLDVCKLSIMSGIEIDKAKKEFIVDNAKELSIIRNKHKLSKGEKSIKPNFFAHISRQKGYYNPAKKSYIRHKTAMDYLQHCANAYRFSRKGQPFKNSFASFSSIVMRDNFNYDNVYDKLIYETLSSVDDLNQRTKAIFANQCLSQPDRYAEVKSVRQEFIEHIGTRRFNRDTMISLLIAIEKPENAKYSRLLFYTMFGYPNTSFYDVIRGGRKPVGCIVECENGPIEIFTKFFDVLDVSV